MPGWKVSEGENFYNTRIEGIVKEEFTAEEITYVRAHPNTGELEVEFNPSIGFESFESLQARVGSLLARQGIVADLWWSPTIRETVDTGQELA